MISYDAYHSADSDAVIAVWNEAMGTDFPMDARLWKQNVTDSDRMYLPACFVARDGDRVVGFVIAKSPNHLNSIAVAPSHQRRGIGRELLALSLAALRSDDGRKRASGLVATVPANLITCQDYAHFFPGVPDALPTASAFFAAVGWVQTQGWCVDLMRDLTDYEIAPRVQETIAGLSEHGVALRPCAVSDIPALLAHVEANFSGRWLAETRQRCEMEPDPGEIKIAVRGSEVVGFAHTFSTSSVKLGPSVYWRGLLGPEYGGLGPIGVATDVRKIGLGLALLSYGIDEVKRTGAKNMAIDWTVIVEFYNKVGFEVWKRYVPWTVPY